MVTSHPLFFRGDKESEWEMTTLSHTVLPSLLGNAPSARTVDREALLRALPGEAKEKEIFALTPRLTLVSLYRPKRNKGECLVLLPEDRKTLVGTSHPLSPEHRLVLERLSYREPQLYFVGGWYTLKENGDRTRGEERVHRSTPEWNEERSEGEQTQDDRATFPPTTTVTTATLAAASSIPPSSDWFLWLIGIFLFLFVIIAIIAAWRCHRGSETPATGTVTTRGGTTAVITPVEEIALPYV